MFEEKINVLTEALPYINKFRGKTFVIKYGGSIMDMQKAKKAFLEDVTLLMLVGIKIIVVHGGGKNINSLLGRLNITTEFIDGLRVTDKKTMEAVEMVLSGQVNKDIVREFCTYGISAVGLSGIDGGLIETSKKTIYKDNINIDIGYVGEVKSINKDLLLHMLEKEHIPVVSPIGSDKEGNVYNINADYVAAAISSAMEAEKLILLTDVKGIYKDINDPETFISVTNTGELNGLIKGGGIKEGMIPKIQCCLDAIEGGTKNIHLIDGRQEHSILLEIFTEQGIGTLIKGGNENE